VLRELLDKHAPLTTHTITVKPNAPWYNAEINAAKRERRRLERIWKNDKTLENRIPYENQCHHVSVLLDTTKEAFYTSKINDHSGDQKEVFKVVNKLLDRKPENTLPSHDSSLELANRFAKFFSDKIIKIRNDLLVQQQNTPNLPVLEDVPVTTAHLTEFAPATESEVESLILQASNKSCSLDPIPTWLLKMCYDFLLPVVTKIVNLSLSQSTMPEKFKEAILLPLIKKAILDSEILKNLQPISNLEYLSKLIERVVASQITDHMLTHNLYEHMQSAYKKFHSTETALLCVQKRYLACF